jgi:hypothetical protein
MEDNPLSSPTAQNRLPDRAPETMSGGSRRGERIARERSLLRIEIVRQIDIDSYIDGPSRLGRESRSLSRSWSWKVGLM